MQITNSSVLKIKQVDLHKQWERMIWFNQLCAIDRVKKMWSGTDNNISGIQWSRKWLWSWSFGSQNRLKVWRFLWRDLHKIFSDYQSYWQSKAFWGEAGSLYNAQMHSRVDHHSYRRKQDVGSAQKRNSIKRALIRAEEVPKFISTHKYQTKQIVFSIHRDLI